MNVARQRCRAFVSPVDHGDRVPVERQRRQLRHLARADDQHARLIAHLLAGEAGGGVADAGGVAADLGLAARALAGVDGAGEQPRERGAERPGAVSVLGGGGDLP